jgi:hypothetical protein
MQYIHRSLEQVRKNIAAAERLAGRAPGSVHLLAVSKRFGAEAITAAAAAGQRRFGENYLQEALDKIAALRDAGLEWHFIGPIQSNKTRDIAAHFAWVHSVDRARIAERLNAQRAPDLPPLNVCLQVNISAERSKSGVAPEALAGLAAVCAGLPRLRLRGLMAIPAPAGDVTAQRRPYRRVRELFAGLQATHPALDTLSMGMTDDLQAAILEGATMVRVGTGIFGPRPA